MVGYFQLGVLGNGFRCLALFATIVTMSELTAQQTTTASNNALKPLILGTAGHIDHGKTTLVRALTGTETDRLPEEKKRGITIELGFANLKLPPFNFGIVDVPGHQKFVRTMLAGATGVDVALLVVAADDSINQQTREHFAILQFLQVPAIVIALTKVDRVEGDWCDLVEDEIRTMAAGSQYADAPIVRTSAIDGVGIEELKTELIQAGQAAYQARSQWSDYPFRMPIDRVFTREGFGTVVTGSITHGSIRIGDNVQVVPGADMQFRVRQIQSHDQSLEVAQRGQRAALNLVGANVDTLEKGNLLVEPDSMPSSHCLTVELSGLHPQHALKNHQIVRLHLGTTDVLGQLRFISSHSDSDSQSESDEQDTSSDGLADETGQDESVQYAQIILKTPIAVNWHQRIVIRRVSPVETLCVAQVISLQLPKQSRWSNDELKMLSKLSSEDVCQRVEGAAFFCLDGKLNPQKMAGDYLLNQQEADECLKFLDLQLIDVGTQQLRFHPLRLQQYSDVVARGLAKMHQAAPKRWLMDWDRVYGQFAFLPPQVLRLVIKRMSDQDLIRQSSRGVGLAQYGPELTKNQQKRYEWILDQFQQAGLAPPTVSQCVQDADKNKQDVPELIKLAVDAGELVNVNSEIILAQSVMLETWQTLLEKFDNQAGMTVAEIRDVLGISRKMTVPLCEHWDREGWLRREGDVRFLGSGPQSNPDPDVSQTPEPKIDSHKADD